MEVERGAWAEINLDAVANNVREAKRLLKPTTKLCAVVKADAYGHGAVPVAIEAVRNGADFFAVAFFFALMAACAAARRAIGTRNGEQLT